MSTPRSPDRPIRGAFLMAVLLTLWVALGHQAHAADGERARIVAERKALAERFNEEERACNSRFAVTACVEDVRARRREALTPLRERELRLDEAERRQKAQERRAAIAARQAAAASRPAAPPEPELRVRPPRAPGAAASARASRPAASGASARAAEAAQRVLDAQQRQREAQAAQERIQKRLAERESQGKKAQPLPLPASAAAR